MTLQDLIDYANEHEFDSNIMTIMIQDPDTMQLKYAYQDEDEVYEPLVVLY